MLHCRNVRPDILGWRMGRPPLWRHVSEGGATIALGAQMGRNAEAYVDDIVVKTRANPLVLSL